MYAIERLHRSMKRQRAAAQETLDATALSSIIAAVKNLADSEQGLIDNLDKQVRNLGLPSTIFESLLERLKANKEAVESLSVYNNGALQNTDIMFAPTKPFSQYAPSARNNTSLIAVFALDTSGVTTMQQMFGGCSSLQQIDVSDWDTSGVTTMYSMFQGCSSLQQIDVSDWDTSSVTTMASMFNGCSSLQQIDVSDWNTSGVTTMQQMFGSCSSLQQIDVSDWDTSGVTTMASMFGGCSSLQQIDFPNSGNVNKVESFYRIFNSCRALVSINNLDFGSKELTDTSSQNCWGSSTKDPFEGCTNLANVEFKAGAKIYKGGLNIGANQGKQLTAKSVCNFLAALYDYITDAEDMLSEPRTGGNISATLYDEIHEQNGLSLEFKIDTALYNKYVGKTFNNVRAVDYVIEAVYEQETAVLSDFYNINFATATEEQQAYAVAARYLEAGEKGWTVIP